MAESSGPENQRTLTGAVGSNPTPSAKCLCIVSNEGYYFSYVDEDTGAYHKVKITQDQLKLIAYQAVKLITRGGSDEGNLNNGTYRGPRKDG